MLRFKMVGLDVNSAAIRQYRTWIVDNEPDFTGQYYTGPKSGNNSFVDVAAYTITDDTLIVDFNQPNPINWNDTDFDPYLADFPILAMLPEPIADAKLAVIDGYIYMFGGQGSDKIWQATIANPAEWSQVGTLPSILFGSSLAIVDDYIYLFGGNNGSQTIDTIFSAPASNPLNWSSVGSLPSPLQYSSLGMFNGILYLFGGLIGTTPSNLILTASSPTAWSIAGSLPSAVYGSILAQINGNWQLMGGQLSANEQTNEIWSASVNSPMSWSSNGYLPYQTSFGNFFTIGAYGYIIGPMIGAAPTGFSPILQCALNAPTTWIDTLQVVRGSINHSQLGVIYDRVWLFGGSGSRAMFACNQNIKYDYYDELVQAYMIATRYILPETDDLDNPFVALCFPYWITSYSQILE